MVNSARHGVDANKRQIASKPAVTRQYSPETPAPQKRSRSENQLTAHPKKPGNVTRPGSICQSISPLRKSAFTLRVVALDTLKIGAHFRRSALRLPGRLGDQLADHRCA